MLRVRLLGGAEVEGDGVPLGGAAAQRKSLAVLALLGVSGDRGISRDKILAYLWPEVEPGKATHRLAQILYALRRELGADDLFLGACDLRLNPDRISSDVHEFAALRQAGDLEGAVGAYAGPFLDGFFLSDAPEFEHWVENERTGLAQQLAEALETLAAAAVVRGDPRQAAWWWQRLADHEPLSSRITVHLMSALAAAGNRGGALERARAYQALLERELEAAPNPAVVALADQLRREPAVLVGVLRFANLSPVPANDQFVEGLTEELTSRLAAVEGVRVAARFSLTALQDAGLDAGEVGHRLQLHALVEGSVRQAGTRMRVSVRLIGAADGCHLWSATYERPVADAFAAQDEVAGLIVTGVRRVLPGTDA